MKDSINLVSKRRKPNAFHKRFFIASIIFFSLMFLISAGLIAYRFTLIAKLNSLKDEEQVLTARVNLNPEKKVKFLTVRERLSEIQKVLNQRKNINAKIESLSETLPFDVGVNLIEGDESKIRLRVEAADLASLNTLIEQKIEEYAQERNRGIKRIEMNRFGLNSSSLLYEATFTIEFI